jgi:nifR3 family TIM-barrel protein
LQIFGSDEESIEIAAKAAESFGADVLDFNSGCPVKKIVKTGSGVALMRDIKKFEAMVKTVVKSVEIPVTVKIRTGLREGELLSPAFAKVAEDCGAQAVIVHGRYASKIHTGPIDYKGLEETVKAVSIPVIGNGGIIDIESASDMFNSGVDGLMIGRGAIGNPFIFKSIEKGVAYVPSEIERMSGYLSLIKMNIERYGEVPGIKRARKVAGYWIHNFAGAASVRAEFVRLESLVDVQKLFKPFVNK